MSRATQSVSARQGGAPVARARSRPHHWIPLAAAVVAMLLPAWRDAAGFSATSEDYANFDELMAVDWLLCETLPIWTAAGETIAVIAYDSEEDRYVASLTASDEFSPDFPERHILVFDDEKTRADFLEVSETGALSPPPGAGIGEVASLLPDWLVGGGLLVTFAAIDEDSPDSEGEVAGGEPTEPGPESGADAEQEGVFNLIISYDKTSAGQFNALMTFASARLVFVYSGRCTPELDEDLRSQAEPYRDRLAPGSGAE